MGSKSMKIEFIGHAAILVETKGLRILADPWWQGPCFGNQWWIYPRPDLSCLDGGPVDYIYISHGHADHFHRGTLRRFPKGTKVLVSSELDLAPTCRDMGFEVIEVDRDKELDLGNGVRCRIRPTYAADTLMTIADGDEVLVNLNDALHPAPRSVQAEVTDWLHRFYPEIDYVFCGYGIASHFPCCYFIPSKDDAATAAQRQKFFNREWVSIMNGLHPRFGFPFAADVAFLEDALFWANEPVHNSERPTDVFDQLHPASTTRVVDIAPGFSIAEREIKNEALFKPVRNEELEATYQRELDDIRTGREKGNYDIALLKGRLSDNVAICRDYLLEFGGDYRILIVIKGADEALTMIKKRDDLVVDMIALAGLDRSAFDIVMTTRFSYLRRSFTTKYGYETLFVGSGCTIEYADAGRVAENLHRELIAVLAEVKASPRSRFGDQSKLMYQLKTLAKKVLRPPQVDLYDLDSWTVFKS